MTALRAREKADDLDHWMKSFFREIDSDLGNEVFQSTCLECSFSKRG